MLANLPNGRKFYADQNGLPLAGGTVSYYVPDTFDPKAVYVDPQMAILQTVPITLDAAGSCVAFGVGLFREYVLDDGGNLISDAVVSVGTPLIVTDAMLPVLQAATPADAEALLTAALPTDVAGHFEISPADQSLNVTPTGNAPATLASLNVQGNAASPTEREFLVNIGLTSSVGVGSVGADKVGLYVGVSGQSGTTDLWAINTVTSMEANSGSYTGLGFELDFNNFNADLGNSGNLNTDFTAPTAVGLEISGASTFSSTAACLAISLAATTNQWNRGFVTAGRMGIAGFQDWTVSPVGMAFDGTYSVAAINMTPAFGNSGANCDSALFMKNGHKLTWQNAATNGVLADYVDSGNNRIIGLPSITGGDNSVIMGGKTFPVTPGLDLGTSSNRWGDVWANNLRLANGDAVAWQNNPAVAGQVGFVFDFVDSSDNRVVGDNAQTIYMATTTAPIRAGLDLGTAQNTFGDIFSTGGVVTPSDVRLKEQIAPIGGVLDSFAKIDPIRFRYRGSEQTRYGFDAQAVGYEFPLVVSEHNGYQHLRKDDLIPLLWKAIQELTTKVTQLEAKIDGDA